MQVGDLNKVWDIKSLKRKPKQEEAKMMLERIASQVQPIMQKHKWRVKLLSEFCPKNPRLLGVNVGGGVNVKLRLRRPNRDEDFYPLDEVLDTMLHELCHNAHGPHNASFYKLWDELRKECEELMAKGIRGSGHGFDLPGKRLGGQQQPMQGRNVLAAAAAEQRRQNQQGTASNRVGGDKSIMSALTPVQAAAMAAERRWQDEIWCALEYEEDNTDQETVSSNKRSLQGDTMKGKRLCPSESTSSLPTWECQTCTLFNPPLALVCSVCDSPKPVAASAKYKSWSCKFCTLDNGVELDNCSACGQWRYSLGEPV